MPGRVAIEPANDVDAYRGLGLIGVAVSAFGYAFVSLFAAFVLRWIASALGAARPGYGLAWLLSFAVAWLGFLGMHLVLVLTGGGMVTEIAAYVLLPLVLGTGVYGACLQDRQGEAPFGFGRGAILALCMLVFFALAVLVPVLVLVGLLERAVI